LKDSQGVFKKKKLDKILRFLNMSFEGEVEKVKKKGGFLMIFK